MSICQLPRPKADDACKCEVCPYKTKVQKPIIPGTYGDLYILGRLWIEAMKTVLLGTKMTITRVDLMPTVHAAKPLEEEPPSKPPMMRYSDLPLNATPHLDYKNYTDCKRLCADKDKKILQEMLLPTVSKKRKAIQDTYDSIAKELTDTYDEVSSDMISAFRNFKSHMRHPDQEGIKPIAVALGGISGYVIAAKLGRGRILYTTLGLLAGGFLCYPDETDLYLRTFLYDASKVGIQVYNKVTGGSIQMGERMPCKSDIPTPVAKWAGQCQEIKK